MYFIYMHDFAFGLSTETKYRRYLKQHDIIRSCSSPTLGNGAETVTGLELV
jgi:hypothetical protein